MLALGFRELRDGELEAVEGDPTKLEVGLTLLSLFAFQDPLRDEIKEAIRACQRAKIVVSMITGDSKATAIAIAREAGIFEEGSLALDGEELDSLSDAQLASQIEQVRVFSRVSPAHKLRVVSLLQSREHTVTMIGDGINDSPALRQADVGCAMGAKGSDISKEASDIILVDDSFKTIVEGIYQGRRVFHRIKTVIKNLLISSSACVVAVILGLLTLPWLTLYLGKSNANFYIYTGSQLLFMNLLTHGFPAISLGLIEPDIDPSKPTGILNRKRRIFHLKDMLSIATVGAVIGLLSILIWAYVASTRSQLDSDRLINLSSSASFIVFGLSSVINALNLIGKGSIFRFRSAYKLVYLAVASSSLLMLAAFFLPGFRDLFAISPALTDRANIDIVLLAILASLIPTLLYELRKGYLNLRRG